MGNFVNILQGIVLDKLTHAKPPLISKIRIGFGLAALSGFFVLCGLGFLILALHLWLRTLYSPEISYALTGLTFIGLGIGFSILCYAYIQYQKNMMLKFKDDITDTISSLFDMLDEELKEPVSENPKIALALASIGGFVAGNKIL